VRDVCNSVAVPATGTNGTTPTILRTIKAGKISTRTRAATGWSSLPNSRGDIPGSRAHRGRAVGTGLGIPEPGPDRKMAAKLAT
jgi:hypothetical protein